MNFLKKHQFLIVICSVFFLIYSSISFVNHYNFRTYALDLGAYTNALYDYTNFNLNDSTVFLKKSENLLADHFDLYLIIFSPFIFIFGTYTLLVIQIFAILFGGIGIYKIFFVNPQKIKISIFATIYFFLFYGIFNSLAFDYHSNVIASCIVPWLFYSFKKNNLKLASILIIAIIIGKENMSLWLTFILIGLSLEYWKNKNLKNFILVSALFCAIYFILITQVIMPYLSNNGTYPHFHYSIIGKSISEAVFFIISHPIKSMSLLFKNHTFNPLGDYVKIETHLIILISGLFFLIKKPQYILMILPIYFQKFFHNNIFIWGIGGQYNIEFAPILAIGIFKVIQEIKSEKLKNYAMYLTIVLVTIASFRTMDNTKIFTDKNRIRFYKKKHFIRDDYNVKKVHQQLNSLPKNTIISAQSPFLPHLSLRDKIYQFPIIKDAEYIVFSNLENAYPITKNEFDSITNILKNEPKWKIIYDNEITILQKK